MIATEVQTQVSAIQNSLLSENCMCPLIKRHLNSLHKIVCYSDDNQIPDGFFRRLLIIQII